MRHIPIFEWARRFARPPAGYSEAATSKTRPTASPFAPSASPSSRRSAKGNATMENRDWTPSSYWWKAIVLFSIFHFLFSNCLHAQTAKKEKVDLLVSGGTIVTMNGQRRILEDGAIAVKVDAILALGPRAEIESKYAGTQIINAKGKLVLPGFING